MSATDSLKVLVIANRPEALQALSFELRSTLPETLILTASDGLNGIELATAEDPDVILLDISLPQMDGFDVCRELRADENLKDTPVIFLTSRETDTAGRFKALQLGANGFLSMPLDAAEVVAQLRAMAKVREATPRLQQQEGSHLQVLVADQSGELERGFEEARRFSEDWQAVFDTVRDAVWILDSEMRVVRFNQAAVRMFGREGQTMVGRHCWEFIHNSKEPIPNCPLLSARKSLQRESIDLQLGERWFEVIVDPILDENNHLTGAVHIVSDITQRKRVEKSLVDSEKRYRALFENMTAGFVLFEVVQDDQGNAVDLVILAGNSGFEATTGLKGKDYVGKCLTEVLPGIQEDSADWIGTYARVALTGDPKQLEMGSELLGYWYSITAYQAGPKQCAVTFFDITDRVKAEAESARLKQAIDQTEAVVIVTATDGAIQYVNPAFEKVTGYTRAEVMGENPRILKSGQHDDRFYREIWGTISDGHIWKGQLVNKRKDGTLITEEATISPVKDANGEIVNFVSVKSDITEHLRISGEKAILEEQLRQSQRLESVGRLAGGVAHDFNNQLSIILGFGENVLAQLSEDDPKREDILEIVKAARRSADLTKQLLAFSRKQTLRPEVLDLNDVVHSLEKLLRRLIGEDIELAIRLGSEISPVLVDPGQMEHVLMNLAVNARDAMPEGGRLLIETTMVDLDEEYANQHNETKAGRYVLLTVSDTGCGMDKNVLSRAFEPFFTTKEKGRGTGLGLATVYGIVRQSNGHIWVYSEPGQGTTFKIYLPPTRGLQHPLEQRREAPSPTRGGECILVVEDEQSLRELMVKLISRQGYQVRFAAGAEEALLLIEKEGLNPDMVITDSRR